MIFFWFYPHIKAIFIIPFGKFGLPYVGKATAAARAALPSPISAGSFRVSVIHRTLMWTTWYAMCVHDYSYACIYIHMGGCMVGTPTTSQHKTFLTWKNFQYFFLSSWRGSNLRSLDLESAALATEPPPYLQCATASRGWGRWGFLLFELVHHVHQKHHVTLESKQQTAQSTHC